MFANKGKLLTDTKRLGRWGEKQAEKSLKAKGLKLLTRNFRCNTGEIDLIMADVDGTIVFVEVKTRADEDFAPAESAVNHTKKKRLFNAAKYFLATHNIADRDFRFDIVTVVLNPKKIEHHPDAFVI